LKKIIIFVFTVFSLACQAQLVRVGPKAGLQLSRTTYEDREFHSRYSRIPSLAYQVGVVMNLKVSDLLSLQSELFYEETRKHIESKLADDWQKETYQYLSLPALLRFSFPLGFSEIYVNAGPKISYWLTGKGEVSHSEVFEFELETLQYDMIFQGNESDFRYFIDQPNRFQLGLDFGIGALFPVGTQFIVVDVRYTATHTNMVKSDVNYIPLSFYEENLLHRQQLLSLSLAYIFDLDLREIKKKGKSSDDQTDR
jgi:hypothetical protein